MGELTANQRAAEYAVQRLTIHIKECQSVVAALLNSAKHHNLHEALRWYGDDALAAEWAAEMLRSARSALGEIHRGDYEDIVICVLDNYRRRAMRVLLGGSDPLSVSSGGPCNMAAGLAEISGTRRAYRALETVHRETLNHGA